MTNCVSASDRGGNGYMRAKGELTSLARLSLSSILRPLDNGDSNIYSKF